jgi:co-chaperonin GroES (HSP10)
MIQIKGHRVLVKVFDLTEVDETFKNAKAAGIYIAESDTMTREKNAVDRGIVVQIGDTAYKDFGGSPWCQIGDEVTFSRYAGKVLTDPYTDEKYTALNDEDVLCVVTKE